MVVSTVSEVVELCNYQLPVELFERLDPLLKSSLWKFEGPVASTAASREFKLKLFAPKTMNRHTAISLLDSICTTFNEQQRLVELKKSSVVESKDHHEKLYMIVSECADSADSNSVRPCIVFRLATVDGILEKNGQLFRETVKLLFEVESRLISSCTSQHLVEGGDERLLLDEQGVNKYYCPPSPVDPKTTILRSSCTCSSPTKEGFERACLVMKDLWNHPEPMFSEYMENIRERIIDSLRLDKENTFCILHPSGSDAELLPLLVAIGRMKKMKMKQIINVVSAAGEVGSGTAPAAAGRHFSCISPTGQRVKEDSTIPHFPSSISVIQLHPRGKDGTPVDFDTVARQQMKDVEETNHDAIIVFHAVDGSKTGLKLPSHEVIEELQYQFGERLVVVLDACQGRSELEEYQWFLNRGALILVTGSKFFCGPGFSGAVLFSSTLMKQLEELPNVPQGMSLFITQNEVDERMPMLRSKLASQPFNIGLLLRWECALREMEGFSSVSSADEIIDKWSSGTKSIIENNFSFVETLADEELSESFNGTNSIVNLLVHKEDGSCFLLSELRTLHKLLASDLEYMSSNFPCSDSDIELLKTICMVGQPVKLGEKCVIRLAIGASQVRAVDEGKYTVEDLLEEDKKILQKMQILVKWLDWFE
eukprot:jgi/Galph1/4711/GphlegSOOS_G3361.1